MIDPEILLVTLLTNAVRYFTIRQVGRLLNLADNPDAVSGILSRLQSRGLIGTCTIMSPPPVAEPPPAPAPPSPRPEPTKKTFEPKPEQVAEAQARADRMRAFINDTFKTRSDQ